MTAEELDQVASRHVKQLALQAVAGRPSEQAYHEKVYNQILGKDIARQAALMPVPTIVVHGKIQNDPDFNINLLKYNQDVRRGRLDRKGPAPNPDSPYYSAEAESTRQMGVKTNPLVPNRTVTNAEVLAAPVEFHNRALYTLLKPDMERQQIKDASGFQFPVATVKQREGFPTPEQEALVAPLVSPMDVASPQTLGKNIAKRVVDTGGSILRRAEAAKIPGLAERRAISPAEWSTQDAAREAAGKIKSQHELAGNMAHYDETVLAKAFQEYVGLGPEDTAGVGRIGVFLKNRLKDATYFPEWRKN